MALVPGLLRGALVSTLMLMSTTITAAPLTLDLASLGVNCTFVEAIIVYTSCIDQKYNPSNFLKGCEPQCQHVDDLVDCINGVTSLTTACLRSFNRIVNHTPQSWEAILVDAGAAQNCSFTFVNLIDICPDVPALTRAGWSDWKSGECNATCGDGYATHTRSCIDVLRDPPNVTTGCVGLSTNTTTCTSSSCGWSDWESGECNATCGDGYATHTRSCIDVLSDPPNVTTGCVGLSTNTTTCTSSPCGGASRTDGHVAGMFVVMATIISQVFLTRG